MNITLYKTLLTLLALGFALAFGVTVLPPLLAKPDLIGAALAASDMITPVPVFLDTSRF